MIQCHVDGTTLYISSREFGHTGLLSPENRKRFFDSVNVSEKDVVSMHLTHTNNVVAVGKSDGGRLFEDTDGLVTNETGIWLALPVADCLPIIIYDPINKAIGLVHAGWRGLDNGVLENALRLMNEKYGSNLFDLKVKLGACICQKHFEVKMDVLEKFASYAAAIHTEDGKYFLDLRKVAVIQLLAFGIPLKNMEIDGRCTLEEKELFSFRGGDVKGRNLYLLTLNH